MKLRAMLVLFPVVLGLPVVASSKESAIVVQDAWIREAPPNAASMAGYMIIENRSDKSQSLVGSSATAFGKVTIHRSEHEGGMARMKHQKKVVIAPHGSVAFKPGGYHLMLMKPKKSLRAGDRSPIELIFGDGLQLTVMFEVRKDMPMKGGEHGIQHGSDHSQH